MKPPRLPSPPSGRPFVLGHRGARAKAPENTLRAFHMALTDGADGVETDVRMTSDGALRIAHDELIVFADTVQPLAIGHLSAAQLGHLRLPCGDRVPSLTDVLRFQAETGCLVNVELKGDVGNPAWMCERAAAEIRVHGGSGLVISSFSPLMVRRMATLLPHVPCALLLETSSTWKQRLLPIGAIGCVGVHPEESCVDAQMVEQLHARRAYVGVWTVNDVARAIELAKMGVDILIGDDPGAILSALSASRARAPDAPAY